MPKLVSLVFLLCIITNLSFASTVANKLRWSDNSNNLRIVVELRKITSYKTFTLKNPHRIVVDIHHTSWKIANDFAKFYKNSNIQQVRHAVRDKDNLRIVFDCKLPIISIKTFTLNPQDKHNYRIIIDAKFLEEKRNNKNALIPAKRITQTKLKENPKDVFIVIENLQKEPKPIEHYPKNSSNDKLDTSLTKELLPATESGRENSQNIAEIDPKYNSIEEIIDNNTSTIPKVKPLDKSSNLPNSVASQKINDKNSVKAIFAPEETKNVPLKTNEALKKLLELREKKRKLQEEQQKKLAKQQLQENKKYYTIVIDPGHGGVDRGATGLHLGTIEKELTLEYAMELKNLLDQEQKYKVFLTRHSDQYLSLMERRNKARLYKADVFISLHADSNPDINMQGASVYTLSKEAYDKESEELSKRENDAELANHINLKENKDVAHLLIDLIRRDTKNISVKFANTTTQELGKEIKLIKGAHRFAGFKVLKGIDIPAILVELGYLSNKKEEILLRSKNYKTKFTKALVNSINKHFNSG